MEDTQIHRSVYGGNQRRAILAIVLIAILNRFGLPVRPIDAILPHGNGKDVMQIQMRINAACQQQTRPIAIEITNRYRILACIAPEKLLRLKANGQRVGPTKILAYNHTSIGTIHAGFANVRIISPVGPVNVTLIRIQCNATRLTQILINEHLAILSIQL